MIETVRSVVCAVITACCLSGLLHAQLPQQLFVVDFEGLPEGTAISTQFLSSGVTFSIDGSSDLPIVVVEGAPLVAFASGTNDAPMASGSAGLTDPIVGGDPFVGQDIRMEFSPPITSIRLFVSDIDSNEVVTVRAYDGATVVASQTRSFGQAGTGDGVVSEFFVSAPTISAVVVDVVALSGYAIDFVSFTRPCQSSACSTAYRISQESAPGAGDFDGNVLGYLLAYPTSVSAATFYAYDVPEGDSWNGALLSPVADRSHLLLVDTTDGLSLVVVHDRALPNDPDGGRAEMRFVVDGDPDGLVRTVTDDPQASETTSMGYTGSAGDSVFTTGHHWDTCCTDGVVFSGLSGPWWMFVDFEEVDGLASTPPILGLSEWVAYSGDGAQIPLVLAAGRRVRIESPTAVASCTERNGSGVNPNVCHCLTPPRLGTTWLIDVLPGPGTLTGIGTMVLGSVAPLASQPLPPWGELLIAPPVVSLTSGAVHSLWVPSVPQLVGVQLYVQGVRLNNVGGQIEIELTNAIDAVVGH